MRILFSVTLLSSLIVSSCSNGQAKQPIADSMANFEYSLKNAHPNAKALMTEEFYWSPIEETAPFGNDDGFDAGYGFRQWRQLNRSQSPVVYLNDLIKSWQYPYFDYNEMDTAKIAAYISSRDNPDEKEMQSRLELFKEAIKMSADTSMKKMTDEQLREMAKAASTGIAGRYLLGQDNAIIAIGFAQFVLEGTIENEMKLLTVTALKRQLQPMLINRYDPDYRDRRKEQLTKMLGVINSVK